MLIVYLMVDLWGRKLLDIRLIIELLRIWLNIELMMILLISKTIFGFRRFLFDNSLKVILLRFEWLV